MFDGNQDKVDPEVWRANYAKLAEAISSGVGDMSKLEYGSADFDLAVDLRKNAGVFAAFKNHEEQGKLAQLLTNDKGDRVSWNEFKKLAAPITAMYNKTWLETEYNQAMANAEMGSKWNGFAENADIYPNLEYRAVMDGRTRDEHAALNGTVLPIDDPFWEANYPPNGWGCRCSVTQTDKPVAQSDAAKSAKPDPGFDFNPGIDKKLFADTAGYYKTGDKNLIEETSAKLLISESRKTSKVADSIKSEVMGDISISSKGWKEAINQPHPNYIEKNMAMENIQGLIDSATEIRILKETKGNPMVKQYRALRVSIAGGESWVLLREGQDGSLSLYTIVGKLKKEQ